MGCVRLECASLVLPLQTVTRGATDQSNMFTWRPHTRTHYNDLSPPDKWLRVSRVGPQGLLIVKLESLCKIIGCSLLRARADESQELVHPGHRRNLAGMQQVRRKLTLRNGM